VVVEGRPLPPPLSSLLSTKSVAQMIVPGARIVPKCRAIGAP